MVIKERDQESQVRSKLIMFSRNRWNVKSVKYWITDLANGILDLIASNISLYILAGNTLVYVILNIMSEMGWAMVSISLDNCDSGRCFGKDK